MIDKTCVITGCNSGIGLETSLELARQGFELFMLMRDSEKSHSAFNKVQALTEKGKVHHIKVDLSLMRNVEAAAKEVLAKAEKVDLLINNAGLLVREEIKTDEGLELTLAVNYFAPFVLSTALLPLLWAAKSARVVNVSSAMSKRGKVFLDNHFEQNPFSGLGAYANSKLLVNYFTYAISRCCEESPIVANCVHPGMVNTDVFRAYPSWLRGVLGRFLLTPKRAAQHLLRPAVNPSFNHYKGDIQKKLSGVYLNKAKGYELANILSSTDQTDKIWAKTEEIIAEIFADQPSEVTMATFKK